MYVYIYENIPVAENILLLQIHLYKIKLISAAQKIVIQPHAMTNMWDFFLGSIR